MDDKKRRLNFWLGNAILALAMVVLLGLNTLWQSFGAYAMGFWILLVGVGAYLVMIGKAPDDQ